MARAVLDGWGIKDCGGVVRDEVEKVRDHMRKGCGVF